MGTFDKYFENIHFDIYLIILKVYNIFRIIKDQLVIVKP